MYINCFAKLSIGDEICLRNRSDTSWRVILVGTRDGRQK